MGEFGTLIRSYCGSQAWLTNDAAGAQTETLLVSRGKNISTARFNHTILHGFLPNILALQGYVMLHTACVIIDGKAFLFAGDSGMGKSTLAAGFASRGVTLFAEDVVRIARDSTGALVAFPSYPGARLRGNSFLLPAEKRTNAQGRYGLPKHRILMDANAANHAPTPIGAVLFLRKGRTLSPRFERLSPMVAVKPFLRSSFLSALPKADRAKRIFASVLPLASSVPAYELRYRRAADHFEALLDGLMDFANSHSSTAGETLKCR
jgi:hypothetical protein